MKRARIAHDGRIHEIAAPVDAPDDVLTLGDGRRVAADAVVWLPPVEPRTGLPSTQNS